MPPKVSIFKNAPSVEPLTNATIEDIVKRIRSPKYQPQTDTLRSLTDADAARRYKATNFVGVTWSGTFTPTRKASNLQAHSGLICIDLDKLPANRMTTLIEQLRADRYTHVLFMSPSGNGLKVVIRIDLKDPADHLAFFRQIGDYYRDCYQVTETEFDASGKNVDRLCFLPYAPDIYYNQDSEVMPLVAEYRNPPESKRPVKSSDRIVEQTIIEEPIEDQTRRRLSYCISQLQRSGIDLTSTYDDWVTVGLTFASLGEEGRSHYHAVSGLHPKYDYTETDAKFSELLRNRNGQVNIGSFFHRVDEVLGKVWQDPGQPQSDRNNEPKRSTEPHEWGEPQPIPTTLQPVLPMTPDLIPDLLRPWLCDIANRMKCPLDFVASTAIVMLSSLIGTRLTIKPKTRDDWTVVPNLWGAIIGGPSSMKTPSINEVLKPLNRMAAAARKEFDEAMRVYEMALVEYEAQKKAHASQAQDRHKGKPVDKPVGYPEAPAKPKERRYVVNDTTVEKLADLLNDNPTGLLLIRDELTGLLAGWERAGHEQDRAFHLEAWNGNGSMSIDRVGRGTMHVNVICESLFGGIQPAKLLPYLQAATGYENDGFVQRLQVAVYPDPAPWEYGDDYPDKAARERAVELIKAVDDADFKTIGYDADDYNKFPYTRFDADAQKIFKEWLINWETNVLPNESGLLLEHFTKYRSLMPSLALIFHVVNCADNAEPPSTGTNKQYVSADAARMAVRWCEYLMSHARRIYGLLDTRHTVAANELLRHIKAGDLRDKFKAREVQQKGWSNLKNTDSIEPALAELIRCHWLREIQPNTPPGAGRPEAPHYRINPKIIPNMLSD